MKKLIIALLAVTSLTAWAEEKTWSYSSLDGLSGNNLITAMTTLANGHKCITYTSGTWPAFLETDVRVVEGKDAWWDMYSNNLVYTTAHDALNIEHAVANSWFGGKSGSGDAYADLFHLNPSDQNANNTKSNYSPGMCAENPMFDNGILKVGTPLSGYGGGDKNVFEPIDQYKGDFARAYFYLVTAYSNPSTTGWIDGQYIVDKTTTPITLNDWAAEMLLEWSRLDPVDSKEINRQEAIFSLQGNRNPFIDYPELAEYIWGNKKGETFSLSDATVATATDRPDVPVFEGCWLTNIDTYSYRWWDAVKIPITTNAEELWISVDGGKYYQYGSAISIDAATSKTDTHTIKAYGVSYVGDTEMRSLTSTLTMTALNPDDMDYSQAIWTKCTSTADFNTDDYYILLSDNTLHSMSTTGGNNSKAFMEAAGFAKFTDNKVTELQVNSAIVKFTQASDGTYSLGVYDIYGNFKGYWQYTGTSSSKNRMALNTTTSTTGTPSFGDSGNFVFTLSNDYIIKFNKTQPRFCNYTSTQGYVQLYRYEDMGTPAGVVNITEPDAPVAISGRNIIAPEGSVIYDLNGRRVTGNGLQPGIYIVNGKTGAVKILIK